MAIHFVSESKFKHLPYELHTGTYVFDIIPALKKWLWEGNYLAVWENEKYLWSRAETNEKMGRDSVWEEAEPVGFGRERSKGSW